MKLPFIEAGEIVTTHGVRGEVKVLTWLDTPELLCAFRRCRMDGRLYEIEHCRVQKNCNLVKLKGVDTVDDARALRGKILEIFREDVPGDEIFAAELLGMQVLAERKPIGTITDVLDYPGNKVYVVSGEREYMIPAVGAFVLRTDLDENVMEVRLIEGMCTDED